MSVNNDSLTTVSIAHATRCSGSYYKDGDSLGCASKARLALFSVKQSHTNGDDIDDTKIIAQPIGLVDNGPSAVCEASP